MDWNFFGCYSPDDQSTSSHRDFTHRYYASFDQYLFVLRISTFAMVGLISWKSNTKLDRNRPLNCWRKMVRNFCCYSVGDDQSTSTEILLIMMTN